MPASLRLALPAALVAALAAAVPAHAADRELAVTVYNSNLALVKDTRTLELGTGRQTFRLRDVSAQIDADLRAPRRQVGRAAHGARAELPVRPRVGGQAPRPLRRPGRHAHRQGRQGHDRHAVVVRRREPRAQQEAGHRHRQPRRVEGSRGRRPAGWADHQAHARVDDRQPRRGAARGDAVLPHRRAVVARRVRGRSRRRTTRPRRGRAGCRSRTRRARAFPRPSSSSWRATCTACRTSCRCRAE